MVVYYPQEIFEFNVSKTTITKIMKDNGCDYKSP